jgi:hypothetical protein
MNVTLAVAPLAAAWIWSATRGYDAIILCIGFWTAAVLSHPR